MIHRKLTENKTDKHECDKNVRYVPLPYDEHAQYQPLPIEAGIENYRSFRSRHESAKDIWSFFSTLHTAATDSNTYACTWLELYILYRIRGFCKPISDSCSKAKSRATVQSQLNKFKVISRGVINRAISDDNIKNMFKPIRIKHEKLLGLGIKGKHPAFACAVQMSRDEIRSLETHIILLGRNIAEKKIRQYITGDIELKPTHPTMKGKAGWDSRIKVCENYKSKTCQHDALVIHKHTINKRKHDEAHFKCPKCAYHVNADSPCFQLQDLDKVCRCKSCKVNVKVRDWLCSCDHTWHLCAVHRSYCSGTNNKKLPSSRSSMTVKRPIGPLSNEQLLQVDAKRMRKSNDHLVGPTLSMLGPILRERFAYLYDR